MVASKKTPRTNLEVIVFNSDSVSLMDTCLFGKHRYRILFHRSRKNSLSAMRYMLMIIPMKKLKITDPRPVTVESIVPALKVLEIHFRNHLAAP